MISISILDEAKTNWVEDIQALLKTHGLPHSQLNKDRLLAIILRSKLIVAIEDERIIGMATLVSIHAPSGFIGSIHDVVVSTAYNKEELEKSIIEKVFDLAKAMGMLKVMLANSKDLSTVNIIS